MYAVPPRAALYTPEYASGYNTVHERGGQTDGRTPADSKYCANARGGTCPLAGDATVTQRY